MYADVKPRTSSSYASPGLLLRESDVLGLEMLFEIIAPDAFLRPFMDDYASLSSIYAVVAKAYTKTVYVDKAFQRKTNELVQKHVTSSPIAARRLVPGT